MVLLDGEMVPLLACHLEQFLAWLQFGNVGRGGKFVPRAGLLASVTAIDYVAHGTPCFRADGASVLYGLVRKAEFGVEWLQLGRAICLFFGEGVGGTGVNAAAARAATAGYGAVVVELEGQEKFPQEEHATRTGDNQLAVFAYPSQARLHGPIAFKHGPAVDENAEWLLNFFSLLLILWCRNVVED